MNQDLYIELLQKQFSGNISTGEAQQLNNWLESSAENQQLADSMQQIWTMSDAYQASGLPEIDMDADFDQIMGRIAQEDVETPVVPMRSRSSFLLRVAAAAVILLVGGFLLRQWITGAESWKTLATTSGEQQELLLADGSKVWLNEQSELQYPKNFSGDLREIKLKGEAFFEVKKNPKKAFVVYTNSGAVRVLGTSFNVRDVAGEPLMKVSVKTGKVQVDNQDSSANVILVAGEQAFVDKTANAVVKSTQPFGNPFFWQTGIIIFSDQPLSKVIQELETAFRVQIRLEDKTKTMSNCPFTSTYKQKSIEQILKSITTVFGMELETLNEKTFVLKGGSCR